MKALHSSETSQATYPSTRHTKKISTSAVPLSGLQFPSRILIHIYRRHKKVRLVDHRFLLRPFQSIIRTLLTIQDYIIRSRLDVVKSAKDQSISQVHFRTAIIQLFMPFFYSVFNMVYSDTVPALCLSFAPITRSAYLVRIVRLCQPVTSSN
jgi:hypothetical protein